MESLNPKTSGQNVVLTLITGHWLSGETGARTGEESVGVDWPVGEERERVTI